MTQEELTKLKEELAQADNQVFNLALEAIDAFRKIEDSHLDILQTKVTVSGIAGLRNFAQDRVPTYFVVIEEDQGCNSETDLLRIAQIILTSDHEDMGIVDTDEIEWEVTVGYSFHEPDSPEILQMVKNKGMESDYFYLILKLTDYAS